MIVCQVCGKMVRFTAAFNQDRGWIAAHSYPGSHASCRASGQFVAVEHHEWEAASAAPERGLEGPVSDDPYPGGPTGPVGQSDPQGAKIDRLVVIDIEGHETNWYGVTFGWLITDDGRTLKVTLRPHPTRSAEDVMATMRAEWSAFLGRLNERRK